tara:strand:- start:2614 stop:3564 length:951 start_codon:yes stop_codon:yes gene_type:complete
MSYEQEAFGSVTTASDATNKGETTKSLGQQSKEASGARVSSSGAFGGLQFPSNTEGQPAWIRMQIVERVSGGFAEVLSGATPTGKNLGSISLYMPQTITFSDGLTYDNAELTGITSALLTSANEAKNNGLLSGMGTFASAAKAIGQDFARNKTSAGAAVAASTGVAINPRASMLFKSPTFRQLALTFKLIPQNRNESITIENIINYIRIHAYPELIAGGASFMFPNIFRISFISFGGRKPRIMPFNDAYCTGVTVNYNPTSPALMRDGSPNEVDLTVNFQETKVLDRKGIMQSAGIRTSTGSQQGPPGASGAMGGT